MNEHSEEEMFMFCKTSSFPASMFGAFGDFNSCFGASTTRVNHWLIFVMC